ncbi:MAG: diphthine--ammonia ligase [Elusimicrobia bacterium]|nr:diphthine--ammonia ligase [Elusimicrobiota bacterium]
MRASVLWTGGKDSALAMHEAISAGYEIVNAVTFVPPTPSFLAHPLPLITRQAEAMGIEHHAFQILEPYARSYERALLDLRRRFKIDAVVTGDIAEVDGWTNWIVERSKGSGLRVVTPLWGRERADILARLLELRFKVVFSCVKEPWFAAEWLGREIDAEAISSLRRLRESSGLDLCGEQGEYHTMVLDAPLFGSSVVLQSFRKRKQDQVMHLEVDSVKLVPKTR